MLRGWGGGGGGEVRWREGRGKEKGGWEWGREKREGVIWGRGGELVALR